MSEPAGNEPAEKRPTEKGPAARRFAFDALFLAPHPDDAEICCGGTILRMVEAGRRVAIVDMTRGEMGTRGDAATRRAECEAATRVLGVAERVNLELPDTGLRDDAAMAAEVVAEIRRLRPRTMFAPHEVDVHPDHTATALVARRAFFLAGLAKFAPERGAAFRPDALFQFTANDHVEPSFCVDISPVTERKRRAILCFATQVQPSAAGSETGEVSHFAKKLDPLQRCEARDRYFGSQLGVRAAEPFVARGPLLVADLGPLFGS